MSELKTSPYGSWRSPITSDLIVQDSTSILDVFIDGGDVYWLEGRPREAGRYVLVRRNVDGSTTDVNPAPFNARSRVHEYGGGSICLVEGTAYFSNDKDQRLYRRSGETDPDAADAGTAASANPNSDTPTGSIDKGRNRGSESAKTILTRGTGASTPSTRLLPSI